MVSTPDEVVKLSPDFCNRCGSSLGNIPSEYLSKRQIADIPPIQVKYTEYQTYKRTCSCGCENKSGQKIVFFALVINETNCNIDKIFVHLYFDRDKIQAFFMSKSKLYKVQLPSNLVVGELGVVYETKQSVKNTPSNWEVFTNVISVDSQSEIISFIDSARNVGINKNIYAKLLNVNLRTLNRYISLDTTLDFDKKEKAIRLNNLFNHGISVFGDKQLFSTWLFETNTYLNSTPISFLSVISGIEIIDNLLGKIDYGVFG